MVNAIKVYFLRRRVRRILKRVNTLSVGNRLLVHLLRLRYELKQTLGVLLVTLDEEVIFTCKTLELPWLDNKPKISCVSPGIFPLVWEYSDKFKKYLWELKDVPGRSESKIHNANYVRQLEGCIAVGKKFIDIDYDGLRDVTSSVNTLKAFHAVMEPVIEYMNGETEIHIYG